MEAAGYITITDAAQRAFIADILEVAAGPVLDVGCGDGRISARLQDASGLQVIGIDSSPERINRARRCFPGIPFHVLNMERIDRFEHAFASAVLIDSLYFAGDQTEVLSTLLERIDTNGVIVLLYSAYQGPGMDESALDVESLPFSAILERADVAWESHEFTANEHTIWNARLALVQKARDNYYDERRSYLYWSQLTECRALERMTGSGRSVRRAFVIRRSR
jgi:SAM-dependent methyltransferase